MLGIGRFTRVCAAAAACAGALFAAPALAAAPTVTTGAAGSITYQSATLTGSVNTGSEPTEVYFQYGTTGNYGAQSPPTAIGASASAQAVSIPVGGLTADTRYHYRLVATNATRTVLGADRTFVTARIPLSLAITAAPNPVPYGGAVTIEGTLTGTGSAGAAVQLQENQFPYTGAWTDVGNPELTLANGTFVFNVLGMGINTQFRVVSGRTISTDVVVSVSVGVTLNAQATGTRRHPTIHFSGAIAPAEPSARIAFERLIGTSWKVVGGTVAHVTVENGVVTFSKTVRVNRGGFYRALVLPVEGSHVSGYSSTELVKIK